MSQGLCFNEISFSKTGAVYLINMIQKHPLLKHLIMRFLYFGEVVKINKTGKGRQNKDGGEKTPESFQHWHSLSEGNSNLFVQRIT